MTDEELEAYVSEKFDRLDMAAAKMRWDALADRNYGTPINQPMNKFVQAEIVLWNKPENYGVVLREEGDRVLVQMGEFEQWIPSKHLMRVGPEKGDITIKLHVASVTEHGAGGGHDATLYHAMPTDGSYAVNLDINSANKLIELGYYEMTLRKVE